MINYVEYRERLNELTKELGGSLPQTLAPFGQLHKSALSDGVLDRKTKELIALGISIAGRCQGCIAYHVHDASKAGASDKEILETIGVAIMMGGGPSVVYGCEALEALKQFSAKRDA